YSSLISSVCAPKVPDKRCGYFTLPESAAPVVNSAKSDK
ncbi:hypothetical protein Q604_UNBC15864G0001, partial [human gut metagenome]